VYSAHLDHLGVGAPVDGDAIYDGALDDASGIAGLIELAHAFAALPVRPARSVLFVAVTAEERGLLGSEYFARHPTVPRGSLVADVNIDTILALHPLHDVVALGADHSSIASDVAAAAAALRLGVTPDPEPKQVIFIRADHTRS
jgi:Zn-dependent M28 family amino/carboxypeptidase